MRPQTSDRPIHERARFEEVRYANCWEDADVMARALHPLRGARCLSIASAGDNSFSLLARGVSLVLAVDISPAQLALVELKAAGFERLGHEELLGFLGVRPSADRLRTYGCLRGSLSAPARAFWDSRAGAVARGVIHCGRLESYFRTFRRFVLPLVHSRATVRALLSDRRPEDRRRFYAEVWDCRRWRVLFRLFFSRWLMGHLGRDPEFFRHVDVPASRRILERTRHGMTALATHDNPYLHYILTGGFGRALPDYLVPEHHRPIRERLGRIRLHRGTADDLVGQLAPQSIDAFYLSDIAEYGDLACHHRLLERLRPAAASGARIAYWNLLAPRHRPSTMADWLEAAGERAKTLHSQALAFFYQDLVLEVVR